MLEVKQFVIDENDFDSASLSFDDLSTLSSPEEELIYGDPIFPNLSQEELKDLYYNRVENKYYEELKNNYKVVNYISFDGLGIDLTDDNKVFYNGEYAGYMSGSVSETVSDGYGSYEVSGGVSLHLFSYESIPEGITFLFYGYCCSRITVTIKYIDFDGTKKERAKYHCLVGSEEYYLSFDKFPINFSDEVIIEFDCTPLPHQAIKIQSIVVGKIRTLNKFRSSNLLEEINILSDDLSINSFEFEAVMKDDILGSEDPVIVYSNNKYYGTFFVDGIERVAANIYNVKCYNSVGLLEKSEFKDWNFESELDYFIDKMTEETSVTITKPDYEYILYGHIPIENYRKALCEYAYACGFMVDGSRNYTLSLKPIPLEISSIISKDRIIGDATLSTTQTLTSAKLQYPADKAIDETADKKTGQVDVATDTRVVYYFEEPVKLTQYMLDGHGVWCEIFSYSGNYIDFKGTVPGSPALFYYAINYQYITETIVNDFAGKAKANEKDFSQIKVYSGYGPRGSGTITSYLPQKKEDIKKYIQSRGTVKAKIVLQNEKVGDLIQIETAYDGIVTGIITSMNISFGYKEVADIEVLEWAVG